MDENITPIPAEEAPAAEPAEIPAPSKKLGMKWHGFLCFWLPFTGITGIISSLSGILSIFLTTDTLLDMYPKGFIVNEYIRYAVLLVISILMIVAWVGLHKFRRGAPKLYMILQGLYTLTTSASMVILMILIGAPVQTACLFTLPGLVFSGIYLWLNHIYFRKRAHLYVN